MCVCASVHMNLPELFYLRVARQCQATHVHVSRACTGVSVQECICMHINVGCVLVELLAQTGYENGPPDCSVPAAAAARPAAARVTANLKTLHKPGVKGYLSLSLTG